MFHVVVMVHIGDTLIGSREAKPFKLPGITVAQPVFFCSVEPPSVAQQAALDHALACIQRDDPSVQISQDVNTGQTLVAGMGELHMEIVHFKYAHCQPYRSPTK